MLGVGLLAVSLIFGAWGRILILLSGVACIWTVEAAEQWKNLGVGQGLASGLMRWKGWWWWDGSLGTESREWSS